MARLFFRRRGRAEFTDGEIDLVPLRGWSADPDMKFGREYTYSITLHGSRREIGQINIRLGESPCVYYYGHIGYHIDPPWRGHHYAQKACRLAMPLLVLGGKTTAVITCDPDNLPSIRTCEALGCELERTVAVPEWIRNRWSISAQKRRYIWRL